ncbi:PKD domain-containing protein [Halalkalirubrum salinum]|uniref:PKD domain-containing protein n=1 Tax=Halalkalirubrum salinum TaxID=2563889 RepID=UPI0010FB79DB|nr:PKD domain-containing protein [Halalkalirubrum salinum]
MNKSSQRVGAVAFVFLLVASLGLVSFAAVPAAADHTDTSGDGHFTEGSSENVSVNQSLSLNIDDKDQTVDEARIILENPHKDDTIEVDDSVNDNVDVKSTAANTTDEIGETRMVIELEGLDSNGDPAPTKVSDFEEVFQTAEFRNTASDTSLEERRIRFSLGSRLPLPETGHYYGKSSDPKSWPDANDATHTYPLNGTLEVDGYLATIRSETENEWVKSVADGDYVLIGAYDGNDDQSQGVFEWETGPEDEVRFYDDNKDDGEKLLRGYANMDLDGGDYLVMRDSGVWADTDGTTKFDYVYEYGDHAIGSDLNMVSTVKISDPDAGGASFPLTEDFNSGSVPSNWTIGGDADWSAPHNGSASDETLRLTTDGEFEAGYGLFDKGFDSEKGVYAEFDYYAGDGSGGADGLSFFLVNGTVTDASNIGTSSVGGAGLGYTQLDNGSDLDGVNSNGASTPGFISDSEEQGVPNAYVGVGFDEYGLFSDDGEGKDGGPGQTANSVAIRGEGDLGTYGSGYAYETGEDVTEIDSAYRIDGGWRKVRVNVQPAASGGTNLTVDMSWDDGDNWETVVDEYTYSNDPPSTLKLGFAGSTGSSTNYHAIDNLEVSQLPIIDGVRASNPTSDKLDFQFDADQELSTIKVDVSGPDPSKRTLDESDFTETENADGNYTYSLDTEVTGDEEGDYDFTLNTAENSAGLKGAAGQSDSVNIASPPSVSTFSLDEGKGDEIKTTVESDKDLKGIEVDIEDPDSETETLTRTDFTETEDSGTYTYTADYTTEKTGTYTGTLQSADDEDGRDGASSEVDTVDISEPDDSEGGVRHTTKDGNLFLGSDFIELGIRSDGGFGSEVTAPSSFFGNDRGNIGIYADVDGFYNDTYDFRYEYFLPGSPEERWSMGYGGPDTGTTASNGRNVYSDPPEMPTIGGGLTDQSTDKVGAGNLTSEFDDLEIDQRYELQPDSRYYKTTVKITNTGSEVEDVRYQRSFDPDNGVDEGCGFPTNNTIVNQQPTDDNVLVKAELTDDDLDNDWCDVGSVSKIPVFYYSVEPDARVSYGDFGLTPDNPPYADREYDNPPEAGSSKTADSYIAITFDAGTLKKDETVEYTYYTGLTDDIETTVADVEKETEAQPPKADAGDNRTVDVGKTVEFDGSNSTANVSINSYDWDFGDGSNATGESVSHSFDDAGTYDVELNIADGKGQTDTDTVTIEVEDPPGLNTSDGESEFVEFRDPVTVDPDMEITSPSDIDGATVKIEDGFDSDADVLEATDDHGIESDYNAKKGVLNLSGEASAADYQEVLRSVTYKNTEGKPAASERKIVFTAGPDVLRSEETGYFYEYVEDEGVTWKEARGAAESRDHFGLDGSLATITSEAENDFLVDQYDGGGWIGANDADEESVWRWVTGPEGEEADGDGRHFFDQTASHTGSHRFAPMYPDPPEGVPGGGEAVDGEYENWDPRHEPNNKFPMKDGQDYGYLCSDTRGCSGGQWMDLNGELSSEPTPAGYFVQYGGMSGDRDVTTSANRTVAVTPDREPTAETGTSETEADLTEEIEFDASESSDDFGIVDYEWDFGDGDDDSGETVTHTYDSDGTYTVTLTVEDNQRQTDSNTMTVNVIDDTVRIADAGPNRTVDEGTAVELDGSNSEASGEITDYDWDLGNGDSTTGEQPIISYDDPGNYTVELEITDVYDKTATNTKTVEVRDTTAPKADAGSNESVDEDRSFEFNASGSADNVDIDSYEWDLYGNGTTDATGEKPSHTFDEPGSYEVELTISDAAGNTDTDSVTITVDDNTAPTAVAEADGTTVREGELIEFDGSDSEDNVALESFEWDFDDNSTNATGSSPTHRFAEEGTYEVVLTATDTSGNTDTNTTDITVEAVPELSANGSDAEYVEKRDPVFVNESLNISGTGDLGGATVSIDDGFEAADTLEFNKSLANDKGISGRYDSDNGVLSFDGMANETDYRDVLRTVTFEHDGDDPSETDRTITFSLGKDGLYYEGTGNYYEYVADDGITWHDARAAANESDHLGLQGYLATVTSEGENDFIQNKLRGAGWMGASDAETEGTWRWVTGPEGTEDGGDGRHFFTQTASDDGTPDDIYDGSTPGGGSAERSNYTNWDINEPNDHLAGEDYAHFCMGISWCPNGYWNDFEYDHSGIDGYVVEYGGRTDDPDLNLIDTTNVSVSRDEAPRAEAGSDIEVGLDEQIEFDASRSTDDYGIDGYEWDFDDGNTSRGETVLYAYSEDGRYDVTLTATDTSLQTDADTIGVRVIDDSVLVASTGGNYTVDENTELTLDASESEASAGIKSYDWKFDNGSTASGETVEYTYEDPGTYEVNLTITDEGDNTASTAAAVEVADTTDPTADAGSDFTVDNSTAAAFDATDSEDNDAIESYEWDLTGNGETDETGAEPEFTYATPGTYTAELTTTDAAGNTDTDTVEVTVEDIEAPTVDAGPDRTVDVDEEVTFDGSNSTDDLAIDTYEWDLYDNGTTDATGATINHTYAVGEEGSYEVELTVTDTAGNSDTDTTTVAVEDPPSISEFSMANPTDKNLTISFDSDDDLSTVKVDVEHDGTAETTLNEADFTNESGTWSATYEGNSDGIYNATLVTAKNADGYNGASGQSASTTLDEDLDADITASSGDVSVESEVEFNAGRSSYPDNATLSYEWRVDGDLSSTSENFTHTFDSPGEYPVELSITADGAKSTDTVNITVEDRTPPVVSLVANDTTPSVGDTVSFDATNTTDDVEIKGYDWSITGNVTIVDSDDGIRNVTYEEPGMSSESVTVTDPSGNEDTETVMITVQGGNATMDTESVD